MVSPVSGQWLGSGLLDVMVGITKTAESESSSMSRFRSETSWWGLVVALQGALETRHQPHRGWEVWCHIKWHLMSIYGGTFVLMLLRIQQTKHCTINSIWSLLFPGMLLKWTAGDKTAPLTVARRNECRGFLSKAPKAERLPKLTARGLLYEAVHVSINTSVKLACANYLSC